MSYYTLDGALIRVVSGTPPVGAVPANFGRNQYPAADRWYLNFMETIRYHLDAIERGLLIHTDDPSPAGFNAVLRHSEFLYRTIKLGAIEQERRRLGEHRDL